MRISVTILLIFCLQLVSIACAENTGSATDRKIVLEFSSKTKRMNFEKNLPASVESSLAAYDFTILLLLRDRLEDSELAAFKKKAGASKIYRDRQVLPREPVADSSACPNQSASLFDGFAQFFAQLGKAAEDSSKCNFRTCPNNQKIKLWAQEAVDGTLMREELKGILKDEDKPVHIAVVDTGFDLQNRREAMDSPSIMALQGADSVGNPKVDEQGHGTMVAALIGGGKGIGLAPSAELTVYRVTKEGQEIKSASHAVLKMAIQQACDAGNEIINVSWGATDISGTDLLLLDKNNDGALLEYLRTKGCLVVNAAGNSSTRIDSYHEELDSPVLRVQAINAMQSMAGFSTTGTVSAPGEGVYTLTSSQVKFEGVKNILCGEDESGAFVNGTSFAAPITAAIAANVAAVLHKNAAYQNIAPSDRITLLSSILAASEKNSTVNGYRAVLLAEHWDGQAPSSVEQLRQSLNSPPNALCGAPIPDCDAKSQCVEVRNCVLELKRRLAICEPSEKAVQEALLLVALRNSNLEQADSLLADWNRNGDRASPSLLNNLNQSWDSVVQNWKRESSYPDIGLKYNFDLDITESLLPQLIRGQSNGEMIPGKISDAMEGYLNSGAFEILSNSSEHNEGILMLLREVKNKFGTEAVVKILQTHMAQIKADFEDSHQFVVESFEIPFLRILNQLLEDPEYDPQRKELRKIDHDLFTVLRNKNKFDFIDKNEVQKFFVRNVAYPDWIRKDIPINSQNSTAFDLSTYVFLADQMDETMRARLLAGIFTIGSKYYEHIPDWMKVLSEVEDQSHTQDPKNRDALRANFLAIPDPVLRNMILQVSDGRQKPWLPKVTYLDIQKNSEELLLSLPRYRDAYDSKNLKFIYPLVKSALEQTQKNMDWKYFKESSSVHSCDARIGFMPSAISLPSKQQNMVQVLDWVVNNYRSALKSRGNLFSSFSSQEEKKNAEEVVKDSADLLKKMISNYSKFLPAGEDWKQSILKLAEEAPSYLEEDRKALRDLHELIRYM